MVKVPENMNGLQAHAIQQDHLQVMAIKFLGVPRINRRGNQRTLDHKLQVLALANEAHPQKLQRSKPGVTRKK